MSELTFKLIFLLVPGLIGTIVFDKLVEHPRWSTFKFIYLSILFGIASYAILVFPYSFFCKELYIWKVFADDSIKTLPYLEVIIASPVSLVLAVIFSYTEKYRWINRIGKWIGASNKHGNQSTFLDFITSSKQKYMYVQVKDFQSKLQYSGFIEKYDDKDNIAEVLLKYVSVYKYSEGKIVENKDLVYEVDEVYLSMNKENIIIEHLYLKNKSNQKSENK